MTTNRLTQPAGNINDDETIPFPLFDLPKEIRDAHISPNFSLKECGLFAQTSQADEKETAFLRLLPSAVDAEPESYTQTDETKLAALAILKKHPELLFKKGMVKDHYGREIWASPYQLFLGAGDKWALKQVHEEIIPKIENGATQAPVQFHKQFPYYDQPLDPNMDEEVRLYDDRNIAQIEQVIAQLKTIVGKITADPCTNGLATLDETTKAVAELCQIFAAKQGEVIRTGLHFPLGIMKEIYKVYDAQFQPWSDAQLAFFSREVMGAALAASTAVDGQCCKNGLNNLDMEKGPDRRDGLFCRQPQGIPEKLTPLNGKLGRTMFVDPFDGYSCFLTSIPGAFDWYNKNGRCAGRAADDGVWLRDGRWVCRALENLCRAKTSYLQTLCSPSRGFSLGRA